MNILTATDGSPAGRAAAVWAAEQFHRPGNNMRLVHVLRGSHHQANAIEAATETLSHMASELQTGNATVETAVYPHAPAWEVIASEAESWRADSLLVGCRGHLAGTTGSFVGTSPDRRSVDMNAQPTPLLPSGTDPAALEDTAFAACVWARLHAAADQPADAMHMHVLSTRMLDGSPDARLMVLRGVSQQRGTLWYHGDAGSEKVRQLDTDARACVVIYDPLTDVQIRLYGIGRSVHSDEELQTHWQHIRSIVEQLRRDSAEPPAHDLRLDALNRSDQDPWWQPDHFAVIEIIPTRFDVHIPRAGHPYRRRVQLAPPTRMTHKAVD
jgi:general stress protein 26/nucleotide-binding universal stress UspA family protein